MGPSVYSVAGSSQRFRAPNSRLVFLAAAAASAALAAGCGSPDDLESSLEATAMVHRDLTAIFAEELGDPASVAVGIAERCGGLFGPSDERALELISTWTPEQDLTRLDAAIEAAHRYLEERDGAEGIRSLDDGNTIVSSADMGGVNFPWLPYETSAGGSPEGAFVRSFSTVCADPETIDPDDWEARVGGTDS